MSTPETTLAPLTIGGIEDAIKARIEQASAFGELGYRIASVATYNGEFDDLESLAKALRVLPAVWVVLAASGKPERKGGDKWKVPVTFAVMVGSRNVRSEHAARRDSQTAHGLEPGTYRLLQDMWDLFVGQDLGLAIDNFTPGSTEIILQTRLQGSGVSVLGLKLDTHYTRTGKTTKDAANAPDMQAVGFNYYLKPGDDIPDATDLLKFGGGEEEA